MPEHISSWKADFYCNRNKLTFHSSHKAILATVAINSGCCCNLQLQRRTELHMHTNITVHIHASVSVFIEEFIKIAKATATSIGYLAKVVTTTPTINEDALLRALRENQL